jgi:putative acetyltransferase
MENRRQRAKNRVPKPMLKIREYKNTDNKPLIEMISTVLAEYKMSLDFQGPDKDLEDLQNIYFNNKGVFFVAELAGKIIGSVAVSKIDDEKCELRKLYILKEHRGQGFGQMLLDRAIDFASLNGYGKMELEVSEKHKGAIRLYKKFGFANTGIRSCCPRCDFIYARELQKERM